MGCLMFLEECACPCFTWVTIASVEIADITCAYAQNLMQCNGGQFQKYITLKD